MNPPKLDAEDYIQWLIASPLDASACEAARCSHPHIAHDAYTRLLERLEPSPDNLWDEVRHLIDLNRGMLVVDDSTLDKPYAKHIELVSRHWSGKHHSVVQGINLISLVWTDGDIAIPINWRVFHKANDGLSKNDHLRQMLETARQRGFSPQCVLWDSWYSALDNLKLLRSWGWRFFVGLRSNRQMNTDACGNRAISELDWSQGESQRAHLRGFGWVQAYRCLDGPGNKTRYFISSENVQLDEAQVQQKREEAQKIEDYHRGLKQECNIERCQARGARKQRNHIGMAIRAFVRLEWHRYKSGVSRHASKRMVLRHAIRAYLNAPSFVLQTPTA